MIYQQWMTISRLWKTSSCSTPSTKMQISGSLESHMLANTSQTLLLESITTTWIQTLLPAPRLNFWAYLSEMESLTLEMTSYLKALLSTLLVMTLLTLTLYLTGTLHAPTTRNQLAASSSIPGFNKLLTMLIHTVYFNLFRYLQLLLLQWLFCCRAKPIEKAIFKPIINFNVTIKTKQFHLIRKPKLKKIKIQWSPLRIFRWSLPILQHSLQGISCGSKSSIKE